MYTLRFDGLFVEVPTGDKRSQAGILCYGWLISKNRIVIAKGHGGYARSKGASSNVAEYLALIAGLEALDDMGIQGEYIRILGDAKSVIDQMQGNADVSSDMIKPLFSRAMRLSRKFSRLDWNWMPRRYNQDADRLTRRAMRQIQADRPRYQAALQAIAAPGHRHNYQFMNLLDLCIYQPEV